MTELRWKPRFVHAFWPLTWWMRKHGFVAFPSPWRAVYCLPEYGTTDWIMIGHELVHYEQMEREGTIAFIVKYLWLTWKHGYAANPFEVEAYARFGHHMR
jgi:hypothetical protein